MTYQVIWTNDKGQELRSDAHRELSTAVKATFEDFKNDEDFAYIRMGVMNGDGAFFTIARRQRARPLEFNTVPAIDDYKYRVHWYAGQDYTIRTEDYETYDSAVEQLKSDFEGSILYGWVTAIDDLGNEKLIAARECNKNIIMYRSGPSNPETQTGTYVDDETCDALLSILTDKISDIFGDSSLGFEMTKSHRDEIKKYMDLIEKLSPEDE